MHDRRCSCSTYCTWGSEIMKCGEVGSNGPTSFADSDYYNYNLGESKLPRTRANSKMYCRVASCNRSTLNFQVALS